MSKENSAGLGVYNRFGPRTLPEGKAGVVKTEGALMQVSLSFNGDDVAAGYIEEPKIPAGFLPVSIYLEVESAGAATGTTPVLNIGTNGTESTNGASFSETLMESAGVHVGSFSGTWAAQLAAATTIGIALSGTNPVLTGGEYKVTIVGYRL